MALLRNAAPLNALADTAADTQLVLASSILNAVSGYNLDEGLSKLANFLTFFFYTPSLCVMLFTTFVQRRFVGGADARNVTTGEYFLAADLSIPYYGETHSLFQVYALFMIALWPIGVPLYMMRVLFRNREGVTALARAQVRYGQGNRARPRKHCQRERSMLRRSCKRRSSGTRIRTVGSPERNSTVRWRRSSWIPAEVTAAWERLDHDGSGSVEQEELEKEVRALKERRDLAKAEVKERGALKAESPR